jgi:hypothetical protein
LGSEYCKGRIGRGYWKRRKRIEEEEEESINRRREEYSIIYNNV